MKIISLSVDSYFFSVVVDNLCVFYSFAPSRAVSQLRYVSVISNISKIYPVEFTEVINIYEHRM